MIFRNIIGHRLTMLLARATAQAVNCLDPVKGSGDLAADGCGKRRSCDRIARGVHVDVVMLEPDERTSIKLDLVREVRSGVGRKSLSPDRHSELRVQVCDSILEPGRA